MIARAADRASMTLFYNMLDWGKMSLPMSERHVNTEPEFVYR